MSLTYTVLVTVTAVTVRKRNKINDIKPKCSLTIGGGCSQLRTQRNPDKKFPARRSSRSFAEPVGVEHGVSSFSQKLVEATMSNTYNDDAIEDCVWSVIEASQNVADHITYLRHFLSSTRHRDKALDRVASLFSPGFSYFESAYRSAFEAVEALTSAGSDSEQRRNAWFNLGKMLHNGYGIAADPARAVSAYEQAIELGEIRALINLGALYEAGNGVERSIERVAH